LQRRQQKVQALIDFPRHNNRKSMQRYLGLAGHFRRFIPYFSVISAVLSDLLKKNAKFTLTTKCEDAFIDLHNICSQTDFAATKLQLTRRQNVGR